MKNLLFAFVLLLLAIPHRALAESDNLIFTATGDGPRSEEDWMLLAKQIEQDNADGKTNFLLHLGDIWKGCDALPESHYLQVAALLRTSTAPVYIVPGDNEWTDLKNPAEGWTFWSRHLLKLDDHWEKSEPTLRQPGHEENIAWVQQGVLLIGISMVGGEPKDPAEWHARHTADAAWVNEKLTQYKADTHAAIIFAQAAPKAPQEDFFTLTLPAITAYAKPTMYLHGDGHKYQVEPAWRTPNLTRVQVDQVAKARPLQITVTNDPKAPFLFDRRL